MSNKATVIVLFMKLLFYGAKIIKKERVGGMEAPTLIVDLENEWSY